MERVEQRLEIVPAKQKDIEVVKVQEPTKALQLIERLEIPELCYEERLGIASQLREALSGVNEHAPPDNIDVASSSKPGSHGQILLGVSKHGSTPGFVNKS